jgi:hypothetical protein
MSLPSSCPVWLIAGPATTITWKYRLCVSVFSVHAVRKRELRESMTTLEENRWYTVI